MISTRHLAPLRSTFGGEVVLPGDAGYDSARAVWNGMIDRRPAVVAYATNVADVIAALRFGRDAGLPIAVRSGGHSAPGHSSCDDGIVIDLSRIAGVEVDAERRIARVAGGSLLGELDDAAQAVGLACPVGVVSHTGVAGLTLGGGVGRLQRKHGLTIDNLRAVELVTAEGELVRASADEHPDLFWGVRGAGSNFGIVTSFEFDLHPLGPDVITAAFVHPAARARELAAFFDDFMADAPDELVGSFGLGRAVPAEGYPAAVAGQPIARIAFTHCGSPTEAAHDLAAAAAFGDPVAGTITPVSYLTLQRSLDDASAWGHRNYSKAIYTDRVPDELVESLIAHLADAPEGDDTIAFGALGGAIAQVPEDATAYAGRAARFMVGIDCLWDDAALDDAQLDWARTVAALVAPHRTTGVYVNALSDSDMAQDAYGAAKLERLVALKRAWDPENVFRLNQNIRP